MNEADTSRTATSDAKGRRLAARLLRTVPDAHIAPRTLPLAPSLSLWLLRDDFPRGPLPPEVVAAVTARPAYWAFCWAAGQVLAAWLLAQPERVRGLRVLDFGAGSGVAGIAAARAGAAEVICCDNDPDALLACESNAELNGVSVTLAHDLAQVPPVDVVLVADVLYDRDNLPLLTELLARGEAVIVADARVDPAALPAWRVVDEREGLTLPDLDESGLFRLVRIYERAEPRDAAVP